MADLTQFYFAFENRFRGPSPEVRAKLEYYVPELTRLKQSIQSRDALDLGCGRGEWLDLLRDQGFSCRGVDTNAPMAETCRARGHRVELADGKDYLSSLPAGSLAVISAFHLVEHIPFEGVYELIALAFRALAPGGLLLFETPNSGNVFVGSHSFYMDPTHQKPLPSPLLAFALEYHGFNPVRTLELNSPLERFSWLRRLARIRVLKRFVGGLDYAALGTKPV